MNIKRAGIATLIFIAVSAFFWLGIQYERKRLVLIELRISKVDAMFQDLRKHYTIIKLYNGRGAKSANDILLTLLYLDVAALWPIIGVSPITPSIERLCDQFIVIDKYFEDFSSSNATQTHIDDIVKELNQAKLICEKQKK